VATDLTLLRDLAIVLVTAAVTALVFQKLRLPTVLGYLVAGVLVGPHVPLFPFVQDAANIEVLAEIGIIFVLFSLGLHFHLGRLRKVGGLAFTAGVLEVSLMVGAGFLVASVGGLGRFDALFLGAILAISSTTIIVKVLSDQGRLEAPSTEAIFGILLVEDLVAIVLIALLSSLALTGTVSAAAVAALVVRIAIFVVATLVLGLVLVPRVVDYVAKLRVEEVLILFVVGIAFATAMIADALELSVALGAFIAGAIIAESRASATVERKVGPLRDVFAAVFFVSTGILIDPLVVLAYWPVVIVLAVVTILGKIAAVGFATFVAGYPPHQAMRVGIGMAMIGEFSFVIASLGRDLGVTSPELLPIAVAVSVTTALVTPWLIRFSDPIVQAAGKVAPRSWRRYAQAYSAWVGRIRPREADAFTGRYDFEALLRALGFSAILVALAFAASRLHTPYTLAFGSGLAAQVGYYVVFVLVGVPILVGLARAVRRIVDEMVAVVVPPAVAGTGRGSAVGGVLRSTLYVFLSVLMALVAVAAGSAFVPPLPLLASAILLVAVAAWLLRGALKRLNQQLEEAVDTVFKAEPLPSQRDEVLSLIRERYPWDVHVKSVIVPASSRAANRRIRDLQLPQKTGATIVTVERGGNKTVNPPPDTLIAPGDMVAVIGEPAQVEAAMHLLTVESTPIERPGTRAAGVELDEIQVHEGSPLSGLTLAGSRIRETTGASVVGVRREGVPILNPAPVMRLRPGDSIVVLGSPEQVRAARAMFGAAREG
jgi:monovalent cation:H+ antiporter-2, CPA2 family